MTDWIEAIILFTLALVVSWGAGFLGYRLVMRALSRAETFWPAFRSP